VLDLEFPPGIEWIISVLRPLAIDLSTILQLDCLVSTDFTFYGIWLLRVFVIPLCMMGLVGLQYIYERRRVDTSTALGYAKANIYLVVFLCYPGVCNQAFSMFNCRELDHGIRVLVKDYSISCNTDEHWVFQLIAGAYVAVFSFGIPIARRCR
jgi:hypothetical protein